LYQQGFYSAIVSTLEGIGLTWLVDLIPQWLLILLLIPISILLTLLITEFMISPKATAFVLVKRFPELKNKHGAGFFTSLVWVFSSLFLTILLLVLTSPLWFIPIFTLIILPFIWGWFSYRLMSFEALSIVADKDECKTVMAQHRVWLIVMGIILGYMGSVPGIVSIYGLFAIALFPLLMVFGLWMYILIFTFGSLWYTHYCLAALRQWRLQNELPVILPVTSIENTAKDDSFDTTTVYNNNKRKEDGGDSTPLGV
jgi:hypothetical protein